MDDIDRELLNIIQTDFPIVEQPYEVLGQRLGIPACEALKRVRALVESGIIRRIGPSFDTRKLGHVSALVAARVPIERLEEVAGVVSSYPHVTHNYARDCEYNLWFTLICENHDRMNAILQDIKQKAGVEEMVCLPARRVFKIQVNFTI
ncbi:MAG: AsnC family transcriptional regulator [Armatimonadota bacterium]|nr:AsnC family transcriptional regulator [Armatimonadota bacterium]